MPRVLDVVIVGGGPAGLYAGARLASAGFSVTLLEEHPIIGEPVHCTGVLADDAFTEFGLSRRSLLNELTTARFWSPAGHRSPIRPAASKLSSSIDAHSIRICCTPQSARVRWSSRARVTAVSVDRDGVTVRAGSGEVRARAAILACGANYSLHRQVGLGMPRLFLHTAQVEVTARELGDVELHFGHDVAPKGFGWAVPVIRGRQQCARVGVMCESDAARHFTRVAARIASRWGLDAGDRPRQKILPLAPLPCTYRDRLIAIGDAAGLVKPTTGGGIYYSLLSAALAADVLASALSCDDLSADRLAPYEQQWRRRLSAEFQAQLKLRLVAHRMSDADIEQLFELARTDGVMPIVRRTASFNRHRTLILELLKHPPVRQIILRRLAF
jgi:flavin-dependent dehydrogenase